MYFVYIVICADKTYYTGITNNIEKRVDNHNQSKAGAKYTKIRRPVKLIYKEAYPDRSSAQKREMAIKKLSRLQKQKLVTG